MEREEFCYWDQCCEGELDEVEITNSTREVTCNNEVKDGIISKYYETKI